MLGKCPKPLNDFREIGCAPAELNINLSSESESGIFRLTAFRQIRFFLISVDCHLAKVSAQKIKVIKVIREVMGLGLAEAKAAVEGAPTTMKEGLSKEDAEALKKQVEEVGGKVELK